MYTQHTLQIFHKEAKIVPLARTIMNKEGQAIMP